jgi:uncharacterized protein (DUF1501 family)
LPDKSKELSTVHTRRTVLGTGWRAAAIAGLSGTLGRAARIAGDGVLVCLHLTGGNDGNNMIVPLDGAQYSAYSALRGPLAIPSGDLLAVRAVRNPGPFGFHPALAEVRDLYNQGALAIVANTGSEQKPAAGHEYEGMTFLPGGHMVPSFGAPKSGAGFSTARYGVVITALDGGTADIGSHEALGGFPDNAFGRSLAQIAALVPHTSGRQLMLTTAVHGFDTHVNQLNRQAALLGELSPALAAFQRSLSESGHANRVTLFTESEFGRSLPANKTGGSEDGWGNHQIVMGAAALHGQFTGGDIHGSFPDLTSVPRDGRLVPSMSRAQYSEALTA